jgi:predicted membrane protein
MGIGIEMYLLGILVSACIFYLLGYFNSELKLSDLNIFIYSLMWPISLSIIFGAVLLGFIWGFFKAILTSFNDKK